jgi:hypothetical protein
MHLVVFELKIPASERPHTTHYTMQTRDQHLLNRLKPIGFFMYHQAQHSKILHGVRFALSVLYGSRNRQRTLLYMSLTDRFL